MFGPNLVLSVNPVYQAECDKPCAGDPALLCGFALRMNVYSTGIYISEYAQLKGEQKKTH